MKSILARCEEEGVSSLYDCNVTELIKDGEGRVAGLLAIHDGRQVYVRARKAVVLSTGGFNLNDNMVRENIPLMSDTAVPLGIPGNDGAGIKLGRGVGAATVAMDGVIATASIYPPGQLIKGILVNNNGERFVAEDSYHGRTAACIMEQPNQTAYLIVDSEVFAYPEITSAKHALIDGWDSIEEMEKGLSLPDGSLTSTMARYNADAINGEDKFLQKGRDWLKPLDKGPFAAFDVSFNKSIYLFMTLGGLKTNRYAQVIDDKGDVIPGLYAAGACSVHIPRTGKSYASGMSLGPGSFFGRVAGRHAAQL